MTPEQAGQNTQSGAARLAKLEADANTYRMISIIALAVAIVATALALWGIGKTRIMANSFSVTDAEGNITAELAVSPQGNPGLFFYDKQHNTRVWLGMADDGTQGMSFGDDTGTSRALLHLDANHQHQARVILMDKDGTPRSTYGLADNGTPGLEFSNPEGQLVFRVPPAAGATPEERWVNLNTLASRAFVQGKFPEAEKLYAAALQQTQTFGAKDLRRAATLNNLGVLYVKVGNLEQADKMYAAALAIRKEVLGEEHPQYGQSLGNIAVLRKEQGKLKEAEKLFQQDIAIQEKAFGKDDPRLMNTLANYAEVLRSLNKHKAAAKLDTRVEAMKKKVEALRAEQAKKQAAAK